MIRFTSKAKGAHKHDSVRLKEIAFAASHLAKMTTDEQARATFYLIKDAAINKSLEAGHAFADDADWQRPDPLISVQYVDGGDLHTKASSLNSAALHVVRRQLHGCDTPRDAGAALYYQAH